MRPAMLLIIIVLMLVCSGCVLVETPGVRVGAIGTPAAQSVDSRDPAPPYASALKKVIDHQTKVLKELNDRKWDKLLDESSTWLEHIRTLNGYAGASSDPHAFQTYCGRLTWEVQALRKAALARHVEGSTRATLACDPILDEFSREFPLTGAPPPLREEPANPAVRADRIP